jgi:hypothetical protein
MIFAKILQDYFLNKQENIQGVPKNRHLVIFWRKFFKQFFLQNTVA